mgnify:CR=1 FL=1
MANYTFHNPSGSSYFVLETVRNNNGIYDSTSGKYASGSFSNFTGSNPDHVVQSNYIWGQVIPTGTSSFDFDSAVTVPVSGALFRGTGEFTVIVTT